MSRSELKEKIKGYLWQNEENYEDPIDIDKFSTLHLQLVSDRLDELSKTTQSKFFIQRLSLDIDESHLSIFTTLEEDKGLTINYKGME